MKKKPLIIFDCFGVLCSNASSVFRDEYFDKKTVETVINDIYMQGDLGEINDDEYYAKMAEYCSFSAEEIKKYFYDKVSLNAELVEIIKDLRKNNTIVLLSDCYVNYLYEILDKFNIRNLFDEIIVSCDYHMVKANPEFFNVVLNRYKNKYTKTYFFDDYGPNIESAKKAGIDFPVQFKTNEDIKIIK